MPSLPETAKHELFYKTRERSPWRSAGLFNSRQDAKQAIDNIKTRFSDAILVKILSCEA